MSSWLPQNVQKRLLLYVLQQVSLFSNVDLTNLDVSLGSQSQFSFNDIDLNVKEIKLPNVDVLSGKIEKLNLQLAVAGNVDISGEGLTFVLKPIDRFFEDDLSDQWASSLTKSVIDMTKSIMESDVTDSSEHSVEALEEVSKSPTALDSMRNKVLQMALGKLSLKMKRIEFQFLLSTEVTLKFTIDTITLLTVDNKRTVDMGGIEVAFSKTQLSPTNSHQNTDSDVEENENTDSEDAMTASITYSKLEATSIYLSAMESLILESSDDAVQVVLTIDRVNIQFQGVTSINDLKVRDVIIRIDEINIYLRKISPIRKHLLSILRASLDKTSSDGTRTENMRNYKRFQQEQNIKEEEVLTAILLKKVSLHLLDDLELNLIDISLKKSEGFTTSASVFDLKLLYMSNEYFFSSPSAQPLFSMQPDQTTAEKKMFLNRDITLNVDSVLLNELLKLVEEYGSAYNYIQKITRASANQKTAEVLHFKSQSINLKILMNNISLELSMDPIKSTLPHTLFDVEKISLLLIRGDKKVLIGTLSNLIISSKTNGCFHVESFDHKFGAIDINTRTKAVLESLHLFLSQAELELISSNLIAFCGSISSFTNPNTRNNGHENVTKKSVRLLHSSNVMNKRATLSNFVLQVHKAKMTITNTLENTFGDITIEAISCILSQDQNKTLCGIVKEARLQRLYMREKTDIICNVNHDRSKPQLILNMPNSGKPKLYLKGLGLFIDSKWRDLVPSSSKGDIKQERKLTFRTMEVRLYDCSLSLKPYRICTGMVISIPKSIINFSPLGITVSLRSLETLLIDDMKVLKERNTKVLENISLSTWYQKQGYSPLIKVDVLSLHFSNTDSMAVSLKVQKVDVSVCSDSLNALMQTALDLKPAETYPDTLKYQIEPEAVDIFNELCEDFFVTKENPNDKTEDDYETPPVSQGSVNFEEEHFSTERRTVVENDSKSSVFSILTTIKIHIEEVKLKLYDGYEWRHTRKEIKSAVDRIQEDFNDGLELSETKVFDSIYIPAPKDTVENIKDNINRKIHNEETNEGKMKLRPTKKYKVLIKGRDLCIEFKGGQDKIAERASSLSSINDYCILNNTFVKVSDLEIIDNLPTSTWNKFLTRSRSNDKMAQEPAMLVIECSLIRPVPHLYATELICNINIVPLTLHVDQDTLEFLTLFFQFKDNRFELLDEYPDILYIQRLEINSVRLLLDYKPKKVDYAGLKSGKTKEFMNFFILDEARIKLKHVILYGVNGFPQLETILSDIWTPDITKTQIPGILSALTPLKPLAGLSYGARALISVPTEHYQQNGRFGGSLQNGGMVFLKTTGGEVIKLAVRLTSGTQTILENTEKLLGGQGITGRNVPITLVEGDEKVDALIDESLLRSTALFNKEPDNKSNHLDVLLADGNHQKVLSLYADQPKDFNSGLQDAYESMERNLYLTFDSMKKAKKELKTAKGAQEAVSTVAKAAPFVLIRPLIGVTEALSKTLQGLNNQYDEDRIAQIEEKYKSKKQNNNQ